jgi:deoxyribonuclease-4
MSHNLDGKSNTEKDEHMHIGEGDYDFEFLLGCTKKGISKYVTLETPRTKLNSFEDDLKNFVRLNKVIN